LGNFYLNFNRLNIAIMALPQFYIKNGNPSNIRIWPCYYATPVANIKTIQGCGWYPGRNN
jgi:hypothetical protein